MNPLWLPKGTVRSLLALSLVLATVATAMMWASGLPSADKAFGGLVGLTGYVMKDYFVERGKT